MKCYDCDTEMIPVFDQTTQSDCWWCPECGTDIPRIKVDKQKMNRAYFDRRAQIEYGPGE